MLASYIEDNKSIIKDKKVLELGAGTALPSLLSAKYAERVFICDRPDVNYDLDLLARKNNIPSSILHHLSLLWGEQVDFPTVDVILASDCFYDEKGKNDSNSDYDKIMFTMALLLQRNPNSEIYLAYQRRNLDDTIRDWLCFYDIKAEEINCEKYKHAECFRGFEDALDSLHLYKLSSFMRFTPAP